LAFLTKTSGLENLLASSAPGDAHSGLAIRTYRYLITTGYNRGESIPQGLRDMANVELKPERAK
jgi:hypothetical protein